MNLRVPKAEQEKMRPEMKGRRPPCKEAGCLAYPTASTSWSPTSSASSKSTRTMPPSKPMASEHFKAWRAVSGHYPRENRTLTTPA